MIQLNLLPDIKTQYIKGQNMKRLVLLIAMIAAGVAVGLVIITGALAATQKAHLGNLDEDIQRLTKELEDTPDLSRILSVQNQLNTLPGLYDGRPAIDRLPNYIDQTTPPGVRITRYMIDFSASKIEITGEADTLELVNSYADTLKYTEYYVGEDSEQAETKQAFKDVVLVQFGRDDKSASYTITFAFDPVIFDITQSVTLTVPTLQTTGAAPPNAVFVTPSDSSHTDSSQTEGQ